MYVKPISTFLSRGRSTPAIRAIGSALTLFMLGVALADDASHAVALDNLAVLTDRLHACANFHRRSGRYEQDERNVRVCGQTRTVIEAVSSIKGMVCLDSARPLSIPVDFYGFPASSATMLAIACRRSLDAVTARPITTYRAPAS